jgi:23S rRNA pseudouridine1911/1915/1917 synthase
MIDEPSKNDVVALTIGLEHDSERLDRCLADSIRDMSRVRLQDLIKNEHCQVLRQGRSRTVKDPSWRVKLEDEVRLKLPPPVDTRVLGQAIELNILYEDDSLIVLNKAAGMVVHPAPGSPDKTLVNALIAHCGDTLSGIGGEKRPGIVHRLDKDTSGVMVAAKTDKAHHSLSDQFASHGRDGRLKRLYQAFVWGTILPAKGSVDAPIFRAPHNRKKMAVSKSERARHAVTHYRHMGAFVEGHVSHIQCELETGRTHQIRVHMAHIGHPVLSDALYGSGMKSRAKHLTDTQRTALDALQRQALHASALGFEHPESGQPMYFEADMPADMLAFADALGVTREK